jgi:hypothetical protein
MTFKVDGINGLTFADNSTQNVTALNASNITAGTLDRARLSAGSILQVIYTETAGRTTFSTSSSLNSFDDLNYYIDSAKISGTITKLYSSSALRVTVGYGWKYTSGSGMHGFVIWRDSSTKKNFSQDWGRDWGSSSSSLYREFTAYFTGLSTGSHTFNAVPVRGDNGPPVAFTRNPNQSDVGDNINTNMISFVMIEEIAT